MDSQKVTTRATQESVMKMLSDDEVSKVSTAEAGAPLTENEPYLDLEILDRKDFETRGLCEGDRVEILSFIGGGAE